MAMLKPGDEDFDDQVAGFQTAFTHRPALVAAATSAEDVRTAVAYAASQRLPVPYREATYVLRLIAAGEGELPMDEIRPALAEIFDVVQDDTLGRAISFLYGVSTPSEHTAEIWPPSMRARLASIKASWDPDDMFRAGPAVA